MVKRTAYLHIGPTHTRSEVLDDALAASTDLLARHGVRRPVRSAEEMLSAAVEIRRTHQHWGLRRKDVEGTWSRIARRAWKGRNSVVLVQPHLAGATRDQIALLLDALAGFDVHVILTATPPGAPGTAGQEGPAALAARWASALRSPDRLHVVVPPRDGDPDAHAWRALGRIVGFEAGPLPVVPPVEEVPDAPLTEARHELLVEQAERWAKELAEAGHDVHGELTDLVPPAREERSDEELARLLAAAADALAGARDELTRLRVAHGALVARHESVTKKRKKLERRLRAAQD
ncbi:hypothetical protein H5V45_13175 [Nocardioides sp. KIGAM211]|uniref:Uncharacterized protein n=1 Tax=Nocardioides luti TaxID=2761101 RepID=A0A7X0VCJ0_9ACTN|nr:hypothetical protein [Nocardioides luti]MBB6628273.1 hypothetical protein [Nocardioides luti]